MQAEKHLSRESGEVPGLETGRIPELDFKSSCQEDKLLALRHDDEILEITTKRSVY